MIWLQRLVGIGAGAIGAVMIARWPAFAAGLSIPAIVWYASYLLFTFLIRRTVPKFSLRTLLLLLGLIGCGVALWKQGSPWREIHRFPGYEPNVAMSPDGSLVAASRETSIEIRETKSGKHLKTLELPANELTGKKGIRWYHEFAFSDDNDTLLCAGWRDDVCLLDQCNELSKVTGNTATFSPSGDRIATVYGACHILDGQSGKLIMSIPKSSPMESTINNRSIYFSPDGNWLLFNGNSPAVFQRIRSERWHSILRIPAYCGVVIFFALLIREFVNDFARRSSAA